MTENILGCMMRDENSITRLFCALCQLKPFREVIVQLFTRTDFGAKEVPYDGFDTHKDFGGGKPDIFVEAYIDEKENEHRVVIVVEVKTSSWTTLQESQPGTYLKWLKGQGAPVGKYFVFLSPPNYVYQDQYEKRRRTFETENPDHGITIIDNLNWVTVINAVDATGLCECSDYVRDFIETLRDRYVPATIIFTKSELEETDMFTKEAAAAHLKLFELIDRLSGEIQNSFGDFVEIEESTNTKRWWTKDGEYAFYVHDKRTTEKVLWVGLWIPFWREKGKPLAMGVDEKWAPNVVREFRHCYSGAELYSNFYVAPVSVQAGKDPVEDIVAQLRDYLARVCKILEHDE